MDTVVAPGWGYSCGQRQPFDQGPGVLKRNDRREASPTDFFTAARRPLQEITASNREVSATHIPGGEPTDRRRYWSLNPTGFSLAGCAVIDSNQRTKLCLQRRALPVCGGPLRNRTTVSRGEREADKDPVKRLGNCSPLWLTVLGLSLTVRMAAVK